MIQEAEALEQILAQVHPLPARLVPLAQALDCYAARDVYATLSLPPFDNSAMDGYAIVASSSAAGARLKVVGEQPAGRDRGLALRGGEALRIFTGAPLPQGADAIVMQEDVTPRDGEIELSEKVAAGEFVRRRGGDIAEGQKIFSAGERIRPQTLALFAAQGMNAMEIGGAVRAAIISTGDELAVPGSKLHPGQIYESNSALLEALLWRLGVKVASVVHCADQAEEIESAVRAAATSSDALIISGGVSVGARDFVKPALAAAGASLDLWRVAVKPGKPFLFGRTERCAIFGLPGNPVSAFVTFLLFVRPALLRMMSAQGDALALPQTRARVSEEISNPGDRPHYLRGVQRGEVFTPVGRQESHALFGLSRSNALLLVPAGGRLAAGETANVFTWE
ncbi:MAG: molybdopterin molybdotransferase MoeA [Chthoniobacterales bacterium]